jgi:Uma2 family endonuclease
MTVQYATHHRFTVEEFERIADTGVFGDEPRLELLDGEIVEMTPVGSRHIGCVAWLEDLLKELLGSTVNIISQSPVRLLGTMRPMPDVSVLRRRADWYTSALATPADILLLVEVADSTVLLDRNEKRRMYAEAEVPEYWVVDIAHNTVVVHRSPAGGDYREVAEHQPGESWRSPALGDRVVTARQVLGPALGSSG